MAAQVPYLVKPAPSTLYGGVELLDRPNYWNVAKLDLLSLPMAVRMQKVGVPVDLEWLGALGDILETRMEMIRGEIGGWVKKGWEVKLQSEWVEGGELSLEDVPLDINPNSASQVGTLLFELLGVGKGRELKRTKSGNRISTGKKQLETLKTEHEVIRLLLGYREAAKLLSTYVNGLPKQAVWDKDSGCWRIHGQIVSTRTDTGRLAMRRPNLQNIPIRTKLGTEVRKAFRASEGRVLLSRDMSQIELRLLAHCSGDETMIDVFHRGLDIHTATAIAAFGLKEEEVDKMLHRAPCKNVNFGVVYGLGEEGLWELMALTYATAGKELPDWLTVEWCEGFISQWFGLYKGVRTYMQEQYNHVTAWGQVWDQLGRVRLIPEVYSCFEQVREAGFRQAGNFGIQSLAAGLFRIAMGIVEGKLQELRKKGVWVEAILPVHDELLIEVEEGMADEVDQIVGECMNSVMRVGGRIEGKELCRVPILSEGKKMERWVKE